MTFYNTTNETKAPSARIPERLRKYAKVHEGYLDRAKGASNRRRKHHAQKARVLRKAASEIDRLRAERSDAAQLDAMYKGENARLNKELLRYKHPFGRKAGDTEITDKLEKLRDE